MKIVEFGREHDRTVLLLHGGGLSWWNYRAVAKRLEQHYHVVLPILDGHGDNDDSFTSIEENALRLLSWIERELGGHITALGGVSLGGQIAVEMLSQRPDICDVALFESVLVKPMKLTAALIGPAVAMSYGLIRKKWFAKLQASYLGVPKELFADYYEDTCKIGREDLIAFMAANNRYSVKPGLDNTKAKVCIAMGGRELPVMRSSAELLKNTIPGSRVEIFPRYAHGELGLNHPEQYVQLLLDLMAPQ